VSGYAEVSAAIAMYATNTASGNWAQLGTSDYGLHVNGLSRFDLSSGRVSIGTEGGAPGILSLSPNGHRRDIVCDNFGIALGVSTGSSGADAMFQISEAGNVGIGIPHNVPDHILTIEPGSTTDPVADAWTVYSSRRWKTNITPIEQSLEKVQHLRGVSFDWKRDGKHDIGLIAEEVGEVIPEVVAYEKNGKDASSVDYARLVAVLIEAVKAQQKEIEVLQKELQTMHIEQRAALDSSGK
jgi:hypothetical protein